MNMREWAGSLSKHLALTPQTKSLKDESLMATVE